MLSKYKISRLPVTREGKLVGIITRGDITRTESLALTSLNERLLHKGTGSTYLMYQSRSPEMSNGKILIVAGHQECDGHLLRLAAHLAGPRGYAIECLHVITVPPDKIPARPKYRRLMANVLLSAQSRSERSCRCRCIPISVWQTP